MHKFRADDLVQARSKLVGVSAADVRDRVPLDRGTVCQAFYISQYNLVIYFRDPIWYPINGFDFPLVEILT